MPFRPTLPLDHGCVLVDTPGLPGGLGRTERVYREIERADLAVMVLAADKILSAAEREMARWTNNLLRGNTVFGPKGVDRIQLEVWQDSGTSVDIETASLEIRPLPNPSG